MLTDDVDAPLRTHFKNAQNYVGNVRESLCYDVPSLVCTLQKLISLTGAKLFHGSKIVRTVPPSENTSEIH